MITQGSAQHLGPFSSSAIDALASIKVARMHDQKAKLHAANAIRRHNSISSVHPIMAAEHALRSVVLQRRMQEAGIPAKIVHPVPAFSGRVTQKCLRDLRDPSVVFFNRSTRVESCGLEEARRLGVSPPIDPHAAWPGTTWHNGVVTPESNTG